MTTPEQPSDSPQPPVRPMAHRVPTEPTQNATVPLPSDDQEHPRRGDDSAQDLPVIRRRTRTMFVPRPEDPNDVELIVSRGILNARQNKKPETSRKRLIAGNLPGWEPMPPGESVVNRPGAR